MNNKSNKNKRSFVKSIIPALSIIMIITAILLVVYTLDSKKFNKGRVVYDSDYTMHVMYLVMDKAEVPKDITIDKTFDPAYSEFPIGILSTSSSIVPLTKKGDYLYVDLDKFTNPELLKNETDYIFTKTNINGEVIDGCEYDKKENVIKVPASYFEENKTIPIQMELQTLMDYSVYENLETKVNVKKFITNKVKAKNNALAFQTSVYLGKNGPGELQNKNVHVYVNNSKIELEDDRYEINNNTLTVFLPPLQISELDVKVDYTLSSAKAVACLNNSQKDCDDSQQGFNDNWRGIKVSQPIDYTSWGKSSLPVVEEYPRQNNPKAEESNPPQRWTKIITLSTGYGNPGDQYDVVYCSNTKSASGCIDSYNNEIVFPATAANWAYTYVPYVTDNWPSDTPSGTIYNVYNYSVNSNNKINSYLETLYTYKIKLTSLLDGIQSGLSTDGTFDPVHEGYNTSWLAFYCTHHSTSYDYGNVSETNPMRMAVMVMQESTNSIIVKFQSINTYDSQAAGAYMRFYWDQVQVNAGLRVKKTDNSSPTGLPIKGVRITIQNRADSSDIHTDTTGADGIVTFSGLPLGAKYNIYEDCSNYSITYPGNSSDPEDTGTFASLGLSCDYPSTSPYTNNGNGVAAVEDYTSGSTGLYSISNARKPYGLRIKKTDDSATPIPIKGLQITIKNKTTGATITKTTNDAGIATFDNLPVGSKYTVTENCSSTISYNGHNNTTLDAEDIACSYDSSNPYAGTDGTGVAAVENYTSGSTGLYEISNAKYRHCAFVKKVKGPNKKVEPNARFQLIIPANVCRNYASGTTLTQTTNLNGIAEFNGLGNCSGAKFVNAKLVDQEHLASLIGSDTQQVELRRTTIYVTKNSGIDYKGKHYAKNTQVVISDRDWNTYKNDVEEICVGTVYPSSNGSGTTEFVDKGYVLLWNKINKTHRTNVSDHGPAMANIKFSVKDSHNNTIRVLSSKANYTDIESVTKNCYTYKDQTGSGTQDFVVSDANGMVCISNLPNEEQFTITEETTSFYNNSYIRINSSEKFSTFTSTDYNNNEYVIDWVKKEYNNGKTSNSDGSLKQTTFTVVDSSNVTIKTKPNKEEVLDTNGVKKNCYVIDIDTPLNNTNEYFVTDNDGYVCIVGTKSGMTYTITESTPPTYYSASDTNTQTTTSKLTFMDANTKRFNNCPTEVEISKTTTEYSNASAEYKALIKEELKKLTFNIYDSENHLLFFTYNSESKHYEYTTAINALTGNTYIGAPELRLNDDLKILVDYLPEGSYVLKEASSVSCASNGGAANGSNCTCSNNTTSGGGTPAETACSNMGYAKIADINFSVTKNNHGGSSTCNMTDTSVKIPITNKPTKVSFTKSDMYGYFSGTDTVTFENEDEIKAFDNIIFRVRKQSTINSSGTTSEANSNFEWFYKTANGEYRYDALHVCTREGDIVAGYRCTQNLFTNRGSMTIRHLCKCETYLIEEYEVPEGTVFILPKAENNTCEAGYLKVDKGGKIECHPIKTVKICDCDDDNPESSPPVLIEDKPTKQVFIKKDLKYNTIITDQNTTFEVFLTKEEAANAGRKCNPYDATSKANDCIQIYFEKNKILDPDETERVYAYRIAKDGTSANNKTKELHVDENTGKLILRYLPSYISREYVLYETKAPKGYDLPKGEKAVTRFTVVNDTINVDITNVPNKPTKVIVSKYDKATGKLIPGFKFKVYKVNNYDPNLSAMKQSMSSALEFKTIRDGSYEYREVFDTDLITTCTDRAGSPCSSISSTLVDSEFSSTPMGENNITIREGQALIQYLDSDSYYVIEEVEAPEGYKLPDKESERYTLFHIDETEETSVISRIYNTENYFTYYKYDDYNRLIDGAVFKLQKLNKDKVYEDVPLEEIESEDAKIYKVSSTSDNYEMTTLNGQATIYRLTEGQYRVLEISAPEGYELPKKTYNVVTFFVDKNGSIYGSNIIANKKTTDRKFTVPTSEAELVVTIQTGQVVIKYGLIITGILGLIGLLIFIRKKISK